MKTIALVIGNNNYAGTSKLTNAVNDAKEIAETFQKLGFDVIHKTDCNTTDCTDILIEFESKIADYDSSIFYFAGHGFQYEGENYLTSIDSQIESANKHELERSSIRLTEVLEIIKKSDIKVNIVIIDACRKSAARGSSNSFSNLSVPKGSIIAFSTSPNEGANDVGMEGHSIYTGALLKYLGREQLSVENLFKKVRQTVHNLTGGKQTTWEHTSLIGEYYFNNGQMVHSIDIPYEEPVVKDRLYFDNGDGFSGIVMDLKSSDWNLQNPAMEKVSKYNQTNLDKNQQFILGRNILQSSNHAFNSTAFIQNLSTNLKPFLTKEGENHVLNGILYEMYFDSNGDFRVQLFKKYHFEEVFQLRKNKMFSKSFEFISNALKPYKDSLFYIPSQETGTIDVDISAISKTSKNEWTNVEEEFQVIQKIIVASKDITNRISNYDVIRTDIENLKKILSNYLFAPVELIHILENIELKKISIKHEVSLESEW